jgi:hypothetical protein
VKKTIASTLIAALLGVVASLSGGPVAQLYAASATTPPALPVPTGDVVNVSTNAQLQSAMSSLRSNLTIVLAPGTYNLSSTLYVNGRYDNITIRGASNNRDDVVLVGRGMTNASYGDVPFGIWVGGDVRGITIANMTLRDFYFHALILNPGTRSPRVYNVRLMNAGEQLLKANPDGSGGGVDNGIVEYSALEYATTSRDDYTNGVDVHTGANWIIRHNLFRNIRAPQGMLAGPAILMWNNSRDTIVEGNTFINCQREIALGLIERTPDDHVGGLVINNFIYRDSSIEGDAAIGINDSPGSRVFHNTIFALTSYPSLVEYRFTNTKSVTISGNLLNGSILARNGATGTVSGNVTNASAAMFVDPSQGNLHLKSTATSVINAGSGTPSVSTDWDGDARPYGSAADIGADEYRPEGSPTLPAAPTNVRIISG